MFRIGFIPILLVLAGVAGVGVVALRPTPRDAAPAALRSPAHAIEHTQTGIDVLEEQSFAPLLGKRVGLITNQTGVDSQGRRTIDIQAMSIRVGSASLLIVYWVAIRIAMPRSSS